MSSIDPQGNLHGKDGRFSRKVNAEPTGFNLARPKGPAPVAERISHAVSMRPGTASVALADPDPFVRVSALGAAWDVSDDQIAEAEADPQVGRILEKISA